MFSRDELERTSNLFGLRNQGDDGDQTVIYTAKCGYGMATCLEIR